jgi:AcrR family transcriptional regulator
MVDVQTPRVRLSREVLIDAAFRIADTEGPDALTLRRLGSELGVDPTAVYRHFRDKDELLAATADRLLREALDTFRPCGRWKDDIRDYVLLVRAIYLAHPSVAALVATASGPLENEARVTERGLAILRGAGLSEHDTALAYEVIEAYTLAVSSMDGAAPQASDAWRRAFATLPPEAFPELASSARLLYLDNDARFTFGLDLLLDAIEARATAKRRP